MKHILLATLALASITFTSCEKEGDGRIDPNAKISIRPDADVKAAADVNPDCLSAKEIIKQAGALWYINEKLNVYGDPIVMGIADWNRDTLNNRIIGTSDWVIDEFGVLTPSFIEGHDLIITTGYNEDTLAYIPNKVMRDAEIKIKEAHSKGDFKTCYMLFDQAFRFRPTTGKDYLKMQAEGTN